MFKYLFEGCGLVGTVLTDRFKISNVNQEFVLVIVNIKIILYLTTYISYIPVYPVQSNSSNILVL